VTVSWDAVATLIDPSRRALYEFVRRQDHPVRRDEAAGATGMSRGLAAFHLDKLVAAGLLAARYEAPAGPRGRGRAPKVYVATGEGLQVTVPPRRYELLAGILAEAHAAGTEPDRIARGRGYDLGARWRSAGGDVVAALADLGFEPDTAEGPIVLRNCPFRALAARHTELVCGLNLAFVVGLLDGLGAGSVDARLAPQPGRCCVRLTQQSRPAPGAGPRRESPAG
jgi:predicted ArsR family transcriptional regulator